MKKKLLLVTVAFLYLAVDSFAQSISNPYVKDGITYGWGNLSWVRRDTRNAPIEEVCHNAVWVMDIGNDAPAVIDFSHIPLTEELPDYWLTNIAENACCDNQTIKELKRSFIPDWGGVYYTDRFYIYVGGRAFYNCRNLEKVDLSMRGDYKQWSVGRAAKQVINKEAFAECKSLREVHLTVDSIYESAFANCTSLQNIYLFCPSVRTAKVDETSFEGVDVSKVNLYVLDVEVDKYRSHPIWGAFNVLPMDYDYFGSYSKTDEEGVTVTRYGPGYYENQFNPVYLPYSFIHKIEDECSKDIHLAKYFDTRKISAEACKNNNNVESVTFQSDLDTPFVIEDQAFYGCPHLESVNLYKETSHYYGRARKVDIRPYAFAECASLKNITLPHPENISAHAFENCTNLEKIVFFFRSLENINIDEKAFDGISRERCKIYVSREYYDELKTHPLFGQFEVMPFEDEDIAVEWTDKGIVRLRREPYGSHSDYSYDVLSITEQAGETVAIQNSDYMIRERAAENNTVIKKLLFDYVNTKRFTNSLGEEMSLEIQSQAFHHCEQLEEIDGLCPYGYYQFYENMTPSISRNLIIDDEVFADCPNLRKVILPKVSKIGNAAFKACSSLKEICLLKVNFDELELGNQVFDGVDCAHCKLYVPNYLVQMAKKHPVFGTFDVEPLPYDYFGASDNGFYEMIYDSDNEYLYILFRNLYNIVDCWYGCEDVILKSTFNGCRLNLFYPNVKHEGNEVIKTFVMSYKLSFEELPPFIDCPNLEMVDLRQNEEDKNVRNKIFTIHSLEEFNQSSLKNVVNFINCPSLKRVFLPHVDVPPANFMEGCTGLELLCIEFGENTYSAWDYFDENAFKGVDRNRCVIYVPQEHVEGVKAHPLLGQFRVMPISDMSDGIQAISNHVENGRQVISRFDAAGRKIHQSQPGLNLVRMSDGSVRKIMVK